MGESPGRGVVVDQVGLAEGMILIGEIVDGIGTVAAANRVARAPVVPDAVGGVALGTRKDDIGQKTALSDGIYECVTRRALLTVVVPDGQAPHRAVDEIVHRPRFVDRPVVAAVSKIGGRPLEEKTVRFYTGRRGTGVTPHQPDPSP